MTTRMQLMYGIRGKKLHKKKAPLLKGNPQKKGVCTRVYTMKPKKPNSAIRKIAKILLIDRKLYYKQYATVYIPGQGHNLQEHSVILMRGGRVKDLPGIHYKAIRQQLDFTAKETFARQQRRSKYAIKRPQKGDND